MVLLTNLTLPSARSITHPEMYVPNIPLPDGISEPAERVTVTRILTGTFSSDTHPPGYYLYVWLARLANSILGDPNAALVAISLLASCGAVFFIYLLARRWFGDTAALFAGLLFVFSPLSWFHGTVALIYMVEAFLSALVGYLCWRVYTGETWCVVPAAAAIGLGAGVRPSFSLFLTPESASEKDSSRNHRAASGGPAVVHSHGGSKRRVPCVHVFFYCALACSWRPSNGVQLLTPDLIGAYPRNHARLHCLFRVRGVAFR